MFGSVTLMTTKVWFLKDFPWTDIWKRSCPESAGRTGDTAGGGTRRPNATCTEGTRGSRRFPRQLTVAGWGSGRGGRTRGPGWRGGLASVPKGSQQGVLWSYKEQICLSKSPFQRCGGQTGWHRLEVGSREFSLQAKRVGTAQQTAYQWQQTRGTGIKCGGIRLMALSS